MKNYEKEYRKILSYERKLERSRNWRNNNLEYARFKARDYSKNVKRFNLKYQIYYRIFNQFRKAWAKYRKDNRKEFFEFVDLEGIYKKLGNYPDGIKENWHIDHIIPICSWDFSNEAEIKMCFSPENLQWLKKEDNLKKGTNFQNMKGGIK